jgi:hypothetical protein
MRTRPARHSCASGKSTELGLPVGERDLLAAYREGSFHYLLIAADRI